MDVKSLAIILKLRHSSLQARLCSPTLRPRRDYLLLHRPLDMLGMQILTKATSGMHRFLPSGVFESKNGTKLYSSVPGDSKKQIPVPVLDCTEAV